MNSICNKVELPEEWKESIIVPIYKTADKTDCSNYRDISLLSTTYRILSDILLSKEIIGDHQYGFRRNRSTTDHIFCIRHIIFFYYWYSALGPVWAETRAQTDDWYGYGTLHPGQVLRGSLPLLSPLF